MIDCVLHLFFSLPKREGRGGISWKVKLLSKESAVLWVLSLVLILLFFLAFLAGRFPVDPAAVFLILASKLFPLVQVWPDTAAVIVWEIRLPRIVGAILVGGALSVSGAAYQNIFRNPLVSPAILGVSAGAGFGAALAMILAFAWLPVQVSAFLFALLAVGCAFLIGRMFGGSSIVVMVLGGMVISSIFQALLSILKYCADPSDTLPAITYWLMGSLARITGLEVAYILLPLLLSLLILYLIRWQVNVLSIHQEEAAALGVNVRLVQLAVIGCATVLTASAVSVSGIIGWVGLIIPHMARMLVGPNFQWVLPASFLLGGIYLLAVDTLSRTLTTIEIPLGILTSLAGAPFFIFLLAKVKRSWT